MAGITATAATEPDRHHRLPAGHDPIRYNARRFAVLGRIETGSRCVPSSTASVRRCPRNGKHVNPSHHPPLQPALREGAKAPATPQATAGRASPETGHEA